MVLWKKTSKWPLFQSKLVNICKHASYARDHNCENCALALSAATADSHFLSNKIRTNISSFFFEIDRALIMVAGTIDATARVIWWRRTFLKYFCNSCDKEVPTFLSKNKLLIRWYTSLAQRTFCFSTNINVFWFFQTFLTDNIKLAQLLWSSCFIH